MLIKAQTRLKINSAIKDDTKSRICKRITVVDIWSWETLPLQTVFLLVIRKGKGQ